MSYNRSGNPTHGAVISLAPDGSRVVAKVDPEDVATVAFLTDGKLEPVGSPGVTRKDGDTLHWHPVLVRS